MSFDLIRLEKMDGKRLPPLNKPQRFPVRGEGLPEPDYEVEPAQLEQNNLAES